VKGLEVDEVREMAQVVRVQELVEMEMEDVR
jgi:hypothetical protein